MPSVNPVTKPLVVVILSKSSSKASSASIIASSITGIEIGNDLLVSVKFKVPDKSIKSPTAAALAPAAKRTVW